jgi:hypothetical protein
MKTVVADRKVAERKSHTCSNFGRFVEEDCDCGKISTGDVDRSLSDGDGS